MADYVFRVHSPNFTDPQRTSTAGDSSTQLDQWLWPLEAIFNTPSKKLGMVLSEEIHLRARSVNWVVRICITLQLPQLIIATAAAYIHRFYMRKPLQKYSPKVMSATALFLATKVEEVPRKLEYVVREYLKVDEEGNEQSDPISEYSDEFKALKQQILYYEDILLRTLCFDLAVDHPYVPLVNHVKTIHESHSCSRVPNASISVEMADRAKAKSITQAAWGFVNDSLMTPLCLVAKPESIAAAAFLLAVTHRLSECPPTLNGDDPSQPSQELDVIDLDFYLNLPENEHSGPDHLPEPWWQVFKVESLEEIYQVANAMLDQYDLAVCGYIRERAAGLARFPGPSLLRPPLQNVNIRSSAYQMNPNATPLTPNVNDHVEPSFTDVKGSHDNEDSTILTPQATRQEELRSHFDAASESDKFTLHAPLSNIPEQYESPHGDQEECPSKPGPSLPAVDLPSQREVSSQGWETRSNIDHDERFTKEGPEETHYPGVANHRGDSTPVRNAMSDNMDLGTSVDSDNSSSKSNPASPSGSKQLLQHNSPRTPPVGRKRSRSRENPGDDLHRIKTPKLQRTQPVWNEVLELDQAKPNCTKSNNQLVDPSSCLTETHTLQHTNEANRNSSSFRSESSLSDMEDGE